MKPETLARFFHDTYEELAPEHGYETRKESAVAWENVPENNKSLMIAVCEKALKALGIVQADEAEYYFIESSADWSDEFDVPAYAIMSKDEWQKCKHLTEQTFDHLKTIEVSFGTNEELFFESYDEWLKSFKIKYITTSQYVSLYKLMGKTIWGLGTRIFYLYEGNLPDNLKPMKQSKRAYDFYKCRDFINKKYSIDMDDLEGWAKALKKGEEKNVPYRSFWNFICDKKQINNDSYFHLSSEDLDFCDEDWQKMVIKLFLEEFGEGKNKEILFWVSW